MAFGKIPFVKYLIIAACAIVANSCNVINPSEPVPTYIHVDSFAFSGTASQSGGSNSHKITAVFAYLNNHPIGVFNMPVTFPVIATAAGDISLSPAIDANGLSGLEVTYPFYTSDNALHLTPKPGATINYQPTTHYQPNTKFIFFEGFENNVSTSQFTPLPNSVALLPTSVSENVFEGSRSATLHLAAENDTSVNTTNIGFTLANNDESYLELDYKSTIPVQIGLTALTANGTYSQYLIGLNPRATYGKIYIALRSFAAAYQGYYDILLRAQVPAGQAGGDIFVDNIKVVTY